MDILLITFKTWMLSCRWIGKMTLLMFQIFWLIKCGVSAYLGFVCYTFNRWRISMSLQIKNVATMIECVVTCSWADPDSVAVFTQFWQYVLMHHMHSVHICAFSGDSNILEMFTVSDSFEYLRDYINWAFSGLHTVLLSKVSLRGLEEDDPDSRDVVASAWPKVELINWLMLRLYSLKVYC